MDQVRVAAWASDPIALVGLVSHLQARRQLLVLPARRRSEAAVLVFATGRITPEIMALLDNASAESPAAIVLVSDHVEPKNFRALADRHVVAVLSRATIAGNRLMDTIIAAAAGREHSLRDLLHQPGRAGAVDSMRPTELSEREVDVLRLLAEGWDTTEIAGKLCYSERTVKNIIYAMTHRLNLRNRPHAVAYALRAGVI